MGLNDNNFNMEDSIFEDSSTNTESKNVTDVIPENNEYYNQLFIEKEIESEKKANKSSFATKIFSAISSKLDDMDINKENKKLQSAADKLFQGNEDILKLLYNFGCNFVINNDYIEFSCKKFNLTGKIVSNENNEMIFDENAELILKYISQIIISSNRLEDTLDFQETNGFYPVGELEKQTAILAGKECEVLVGTLQNNKGEVKKVYYYNGQEVFPAE